MIQKLFSLLYKAIRKVLNSFLGALNYIFCNIIFYCQNVRFKNFTTHGIPYVMVAIGGKCSIGKNFKMNNGIGGNPIGRPQKCTFFVDKNANLTIGDNVGMSQTAIICHHKISIGNNVKIGGGVCIYDTDFHSLDPSQRNDPQQDFKNKINKPVVIEDNVFIGAHSTILKGVTIANNSIIGACSVVTKNVPPNEIWAGNPARFIKKLNFN
jgi:acetyltransferase-like isoleucine patch superfamily enzyme